MIRPVLAVLVSVAAVSALSGCSSSTTAGPSQTAASFNKATGNISATVDRPLDRTFEASKDAMNDLGFTTTKSNKDALQGIIEAKEADNSTIKVNLARKADNLTEVVVNVGVFGSESKANLILNKILDRLGR